MHVDLRPHPDTPSIAIAGISATAARTENGELVIRYVVIGDLGAVRLPPPVRYASRADELWKTTCFEAFVRADGDSAYNEMNFAPSTAWAAYRFASYRSDMHQIGLAAPHVDVDLRPDALELIVSIDCNAVEFDLARPWTLGISAVIEEVDGRKSYWALAHPPGKPDFHHSDCFVLKLPAAI